LIGVEGRGSLLPLGKIGTVASISGEARIFCITGDQAMNGIGQSIGLGLAVAACLGVFTANAQAQSAEAKTKITATDLKCKGCVDKKDIGKNAVKSKNIKDGQVKAPDLGQDSVTLEKLDDSAKTITAAAGRSNLGIGTYLSGPTVMNTIDLAVPGSGVVVATFSVPMFFATDGQAACLVYEGASPPAGTTLACIQNGTTSSFRTCAGVQPIPVDGPGTVSLKLRCHDNGGNVAVSAYSFVATYSQKTGTMDIKASD
jgi:hypothetical protein